MKLTRSTRAGIALVAAAGLAALGLGVPTQAAARTTVVVAQSNAMTSLNPGMGDTNLVTNSDIAYLSTSGFYYFDSAPKMIRNTAFGEFKIIKKEAKDFRVQYTVKPGRVWSDGTPITAVDLLFSHVLSSGKWSIAAGLGDPSSDKGGAFKSIGYGGPYDSNVVGNPILSPDKMSVTIRYKAFQPDWEIMGPGPSPVHTLVLLAQGKKGLQSSAANLAAKAKFLTAYQKKDTALFKTMARVWNTKYNITNINKSTNKLLLVGNGPYLVTGAVEGQSTTMELNPKYNSGPAVKGIKKVVFRYVADGTPSAQALANGEIDVYSGQPTPDTVAALKAIGPRVKLIGSTQAAFEHIDLRVDTSWQDATKTPYTGPFAGDSQKAKDLRTAFLLTVPRDKIVSTLVKPVSPTAQVINSSFTLPGQPGYTDIVKQSGVSKFTAGTQDQRTAAALALVKKYYPNASATNSVVDVKMLWGSLTNQRRAAEFQLMQTESKKAGFNLTNPPYEGGWSDNMDSSTYDAMFFAWVLSAPSQTGTNANFQSDGGNNSLGYKSAAMDKILKSLESYMSPSQVIAKYIAAEKLLISDALTLPIFQHPAVAAINAKLKGVKPAPLTPNMVWNVWDWSF